MPNLAFAGLLDGGWRDLAFEPFRDGISVHWLLKGGPVEPSVAILSYQPGASVPRHRHVGLETIVVLEGTVLQQNGRRVTVEGIDPKHLHWPCSIPCRIDPPVQKCGDDPVEILWSLAL